MKAERFGGSSILTLNALNFWRKKIWSQSKKKRIKSQKLRMRKRRGSKSGREEVERQSDLKKHCQPLVLFLDSLRIRGKLGVIRPFAL